MGRTILVSGAGGFIGSAVTRRLVRWAEAGAVLWDGESVDAVCALLRPGSSTERLEDVLQSPLLAVERADITVIGALKELMGRCAPKAVLHLAFDPSGFEPQTESEWRARHLAPLETMFEALSRVGGARFVHTSSAWVLAPGEQLAEDALVAPSLDYAKAKTKLDEALATLHREHGVPFVNLRLFNVFGRYEDIHRLLPHLVDRWRSSRPARLTHGEQVRDFNNVDDIAEAYRLALLCPPSACGAVYHIGSGRGVSVREFAMLVRAAMDVPGEIEFNTARTRDQHVPALVSNPSLATRVLGWQPRDDLEVCIRDAVKWWLARPTARDEGAA
ncbi:MAG: NAD-dependent epimerase/dehydratase family protein [Gemmatimonadales bacterium]